MLGVFSLPASFLFFELTASLYEQWEGPWLGYRWMVWCALLHSRKSFNFTFSCFSSPLDFILKTLNQDFGFAQVDGTVSPAAIRGGVYLKYNAKSRVSTERVFDLRE